MSNADMGDIWRLSNLMNKNIENTLFSAPDFSPKNTCSGNTGREKV